ncbi:hypothetical protein CDAR_517991 [Caerostris darwini]|uniref:Uncharacterized protein n=1 Tax=Caerostris darwini TaxID=1538125 RepID=A0AAV4QR01_9ARAC|nr:hypothetical protein CDAR_517991 [Caerostris darwini]
MFILITTPSPSHWNRGCLPSIRHQRTQVCRITTAIRTCRIEWPIRGGHAQLASSATTRTSLMGSEHAAHIISFRASVTNVSVHESVMNPPKPDSADIRIRSVSDPERESHLRSEIR